MRYRRLHVRYAAVAPSGHPWPFDDLWPSDRVRILVQASWRPEADLYETPTTVEAIVALPGIEEDDVDIQLFENVLVVEGQRRLPVATPEVLYHTAGIRQGAFQIALALPARIDPDGVQARYDRGLLLITLPKRGATA